YSRVRLSSAELQGARINDDGLRYALRPTGNPAVQNQAWSGTRGVPGIAQELLTGLDLANADGPVEGAGVWFPDAPAARQPAVLHTGAMGAAVETRDLTRSFGTEKALDSLSFDVEAGEVVALLGPNGAGKTTTVRLLNGLLRLDAGTTRVLGLDPTADGTDRRRRTGVLTEQSGLDERLTALEHVAFTARIRGPRPAD